MPGLQYASSSTNDGSRAVKMIKTWNDEWKRFETVLVKDRHHLSPATCRRSTAARTYSKRAKIAVPTAIIISTSRSVATRLWARAHDMSSHTAVTTPMTGPTTVAHFGRRFRSRSRPFSAATHFAHCTRVSAVVLRVQLRLRATSAARPTCDGSSVRSSAP